MWDRAFLAHTVPGCEALGRPAVARRENVHSQRCPAGARLKKGERYSREGHGGVQRGLLRVGRQGNKTGMGARMDGGASRGPDTQNGYILKRQLPYLAQRDTTPARKPDQPLARQHPYPRTAKEETQKKKKKPAT